MNVTKLASEFEMDPVLIRAIRLLHSIKPHKVNLKTLHDKYLRTLKHSLPREIRKTISKKHKSIKSGSKSHSHKRSKSSKKDKEKVKVKTEKSSKKTEKSSNSKVKKSKNSKDKKAEKSGHSSSKKSKSSSKEKSSKSSSSSSSKKSKKSKKSSKHSSSSSKSSIAKTVSSIIATFNATTASSPQKDSPDPSRTSAIDDSTTEDEGETITGKSTFNVEGEDQSCKVCKKTNFTTRNQLVECQECHNLYHQECHAPKMLSADIVDPRFVWYCAKCSHQMNKMTIKTTVRAVDQDNSSNGSSTGSSLVVQSPKAFKRFDMSKSLLKETSRTSSPTLAVSNSSGASAGVATFLTSTSVSSTVSKQKGLSGMAANLSRQFGASAAAATASAATTTEKPKHSISFLQNLPMNPVKPLKRVNKTSTQLVASKSGGKPVKKRKI